MANKKRKYGEGSIFLRKDGRWEGRVVVDYKENGNPKIKSVAAIAAGGPRMAASI